MITKIVRVTGLTLIILFCAASVRELTDPDQGKIYSYLSFFEDRFYDMRMMITLDKEKKDDRLVLAKIDDKTLKKVGRWPFSRTYWAQFIRKAKIFGAKVVAFDVFFSEPEEVCNEVSPDVDLATSIKEFQQTPGNRVILPYSTTFNPYRKSNLKEIPPVMFDFILNTKQEEGVEIVKSYMSNDVFPIKILTETGSGLAHIVADDDADGIFRHYQLVSNVDDLYFPSFGLLSYEAFTGIKTTLELSNLSPFSLNNGTNHRLYLNYKGQNKIRWLGGRGHFPEVSVVDIINAPDDDQEMKKALGGSLLFVGSTAFGAHDFRHTPVDAMLPGVFLHMNMTHMLLESSFMKDKVDSTLISWSILLLGTLLIIVIQLFGHAIWDLIALATIVGGVFYLDTVYLTPMGYEVKLFFCLLSVIACYSWTTLLNFYLASRDRHFLKNAFGSYISPELIEEMYKSGESPKLGGVSDILTAYFTDIQGFSSFSEKLTAPQLVELLNEYLTEMTDILLNDKGTLDKYEGDAIIAFFGAPMPVPTHASNACQVAIAMQNALLKLRKKWKSEGEKWPQIVHDMRMRIGINSGEIVTGNMGSRDRMNYTMMGDAVNLAARLESAAKQYGIYTMISNETRKMAGEQFTIRKLDKIQVVGKEEPVITYELIGQKGNTDQVCTDLIDKFHQGLELYYQQDWDNAIATFQQSLELEYQRDPEGKEQGNINPSLLYIDRCEQFKENPPAEDWDGVFRMTSK